MVGNACVSANRPICGFTHIQVCCVRKGLTSSTGETCPLMLATANCSRQQKFKAERRLSLGLSVGWAMIGKRGSWAEPQERSDKVEQSTGTKWQSWAERKCPNNAGLDSERERERGREREKEKERERERKRERERERKRERERGRGRERENCNFIPLFVIPSPLCMIMPCLPAHRTAWLKCSARWSDHTCTFSPRPQTQSTTKPCTRLNALLMSRLPFHRRTCRAVTMRHSRVITLRKSLKQGSIREGIPNVPPVASRQMLTLTQQSPWDHHASLFVITRSLQQQVSMEWSTLMFMPIKCPVKSNWRWRTACFSETNVPIWQTMTETEAVFFLFLLCKKIDRMPDKSWRGMRLGPVTALCNSYAFSDCIRNFASCFICSGVQLTWIFFFWLCFETPQHSCKCVYLQESEKGVTLKQL